MNFIIFGNHFNATNTHGACNKKRKQLPELWPYR